MKQIIIAMLIFISTVNNAQQGSDLAFSKSYSFEYDNQYTKAISSIVDLHSDTYQINLRLGWLYYLSKDYTKSEQYYKKAITQEKTSIEARFGLVLPMSAVANWNAILSTYLEIIKLDPNNSIANYRIASIYNARKDYLNSNLYVVKVLKLYPFDFDSNLLYSKNLIALGKNADAKKHLNMALEYNPQSEEAKTLSKKL
jgi:tetratricopeptide (TPR) repeat protein